MSSVSVRFNSFLFFIRFSMNTVEGQWKVKSEEWRMNVEKRFAFFFLFYSLLPLTYSLHFMVGLDGLEPSTSRLSGVRSNHLSYRPFLLVVPRSFPSWFRRFRRLVEMMGFEPMTPCLQGRCSPSWATPPYHGLSFSKIISDLRKLNNKSFHTSCFRSRQSTPIHSWKRIMVSIERRWSSRTFRYGYLVTT